MFTTAIVVAATALDGFVTTLLDYRFPIALVIALGAAVMAGFQFFKGRASGGGLKGVIVTAAAGIVAVLAVIYLPAIAATGANTVKDDGNLIGDPSSLLQNGK